MNVIRFPFLSSASGLAESLRSFSQVLALEGKEKGQINGRIELVCDVLKYWNDREAKNPLATRRAAVLPALEVHSQISRFQTSQMRRFYSYQIPRLRIDLHQPKNDGRPLKGRIIAGLRPPSLFQDEAELVERCKWSDLLTAVAGCLQCNVKHFPTASLSITINSNQIVTSPC